jgi:hypothetical protein
MGFFPIKEYPQENVFTFVQYWEVNNGTKKTLKAERKPHEYTDQFNVSHNILRANVHYCRSAKKNFYTKSIPWVITCIKNTNMGSIQPCTEIILANLPRLIALQIEFNLIYHFRL